MSRRLYWRRRLESGDRVRLLGLERERRIREFIMKILVVDVNRLEEFIKNKM